MRVRLPIFVVPLLPLALAACGQESQGVTLRSLEASGRTSVVCLEVTRRGSDGNFLADYEYAPRDISDCPQPAFEGSNGIRQPFALVTQTTRGEVAVVNLEGSVVDLEPTSPGFGFLPIGASPVDIVSTPGSVASFVGVAEVGKEGIFAIPSTCLRPRQDDEPVRGITSWPACRLPSAPGEMAVLIDPADAAGGVRESCDAPVVDLPTPASAERELCPADLRVEVNPPGRRKLLVALPDRSELVVIDAQELLDRPPGSYDACAIERRVPLQVNLPAAPIQQVLPPDLTEACRPADVERLDASHQARPAGFARVEDPTTDEHRLYVGDLEAPVVHVLDVRNPCAIQEEPPLLPRSFLEPGRSVTTRNLAVSPLTSDQQRFLYAVDYRDRGSVMVFDVSPTSTSRTPLLRPGFPTLPFEPPDRLRFDAPVQDITFAYRDRVEASDETGNEAEGVLCDPDPALASSAPGARYRPAADFSSGASPRRLRGVFGFAVLDSGEVSVIDVDDLDRKCRRPATANTSDVPDFRGCAGDEAAGPFRLSPGDPSSRATVTEEVSCRTVQPHRIRSRLFVRSDPDFSVAAPSLRSRPRLVSETGRTLLTDRSEVGRQQPRMLGVNFSASAPAQVNIGTTLLQAGGEDQPLDIDPATASAPSVVLSLAEPRAYFGEEQFTATYEGIIVGTRPAADFQLEGSQARLVDSGIGFCSLGIEDQLLARDRGARVGAPLERLEEFGRRHADFVTITSDLPDKDDAYWDGVGSVCAFQECRAAFGTARVPNDRRELRVVEARSGELLVEPRKARDSAERRHLNELFECCFPQAVSYNVRGSGQWIVQGSGVGFHHAITTDASGRCVRDPCSPRANEAESRLLEVSCADDGSCPLDAEGVPAIGLAEPDDIACVVNAGAAPATFSPLDAGSVRTLGGSGCIFRGLTSRFVMYRGLLPSRRDMQWTWLVQGGFERLSVGLASAVDPNAVPESMWYSEELDRLIVTDGATKGLILMSLDPFGSVQQYF